MSGEIWPNSEIEVTIIFNPNIAADYSSQAYLDITGMERRDVLDLFGTGIGPKAMFAYDVLDIGDVFVNSKHRYELTLKNKGDIDATYQLNERETPFGPKFKFMPQRGVLEVGDSDYYESVSNDNSPSSSKRTEMTYQASGSPRGKGRCTTQSDSTSRSSCRRMRECCQ